MLYNDNRGDNMARKKFTTNLDEKTIRDIKLQAVLENTDVSKIIERLIHEYLEKEKKSRV